MASMERWQGKVALVTGAGSGIGAATAKRLVEEGVTVVGLDKRGNKVEEILINLTTRRDKLYSFQADVTKEDDVLRAFKWMKENVGPAYILINCAGVFYQRPLIKGNTSEWRKTLDVNVIGICTVTREAIKVMREYDIDGHIVNINSLLGHQVVLHTGIYSPSKFALTAVTETLRLELLSLGSKIKVTSISPGMVDTPLIKKLEKHEYLPKYVKFKLRPEDVADAIVYTLSTPPHVLVQELTLRHIEQIGNAKKLKGKHISIAEDQSWEDRETTKILVKYLKEAKAKGKRVQIKGNKLKIESEVYTVEDLQSGRHEHESGEEEVQEEDNNNPSSVLTQRKQKPEAAKPSKIKSDPTKKNLRSTATTSFKK